jgi:hypothetical protein
MKKGFSYTIGIMILLAAAGGTWFFLTLGERDIPTAAIDGDATMIGKQKVLKVVFADEGQGLRHTEILVTQDNRPRVLSSVDHQEAGVKRKEISVALDASTLKLSDGPATLTLVAVDHSLWKNRTVVTKEVRIDLMSPQISQFNPRNHINPGGACVVTYGLSEAVARTGVQVGDLFYPGYPLTVAGKPVYVAYFAVPIEAGPGNPQIRILAEDPAGNQTLSAIPALIKKKIFRSDTMNLSDAFLEKIRAEFQADIPALRGKTPIETFTHINTQLRVDNNRMLQSIGKKTEPRQLWNDVFLRMKNAAPMGLFGDRRTYLHQGKPVGGSVHLGVDLASLARSPVEAANSGTVVFTGPLGIYGNTVVVDHGLGLSTLYSHLSAIQVRPEQRVARGEVMGTSGFTGLAGGDHLHFGVAIHGQFVDPREWWDPHWIADNVTLKMAAAQ